MAICAQGNYWGCGWRCWDAALSGWMIRVGRIAKNCMADAVAAVTGVRLGKRSLKYFDYGKVAATFLNTESGEAVRIVALEESRALADARYPQIENKKERQFRAYGEADDTELFKVERVQVAYGEMDAPGRPRARITCARCVEGVNDGREVKTKGGELLCRACALGGYYKKFEPGTAV